MTDKQRKIQYKLVLAGAGATAVVAMGTLGTVVSESPFSGASFSEAPEASIGETSTETTAPSEPETSVATPPVTVELPDGYGNG